MARSSSFSNMVIVLTITAFVCSAALGLVYSVTKEPIAEAKIARINASIAVVVPPFDNNPSENPIEVEVDGRIMRLYVAKKGDEVIGVAVESFSNMGFSGLITLMVGFLPDGTINDIAVLAHNETPGLGDKMEKRKDERFAVQFDGQHPNNFRLALRKDGGDVDVITAATITSRAFIDAVRRAFEVFEENKQSWEIPQS